METRFLESFVAVAESGSIADAARRLNLTPTAVAQRIRVLEQELGVALIARSGRTVRVTEGGTRILAKAHSFQRELRELKAAASDQSFSGELRIGTINTGLTGLMPSILARLAEAHPGVEVHIQAGVSRALYQLVVQGELDAVLIIEPQFAVPKSLIWRKLSEEKLMVLAPRSLAHADPLALLATQPLIRYDRQNWGGWLADQYLQQQGIHPTERFELHTLDAIALLVERGLGVSLVPDWVRAWPLPPTLVKLALPGEVPSRRVGMVWPARSHFSRLLDALLAEPAA